MSALRNSLEEKYRVQWTAEGEARGEARGKAEENASSLVQYVQRLINGATCSSVDDACKLLGRTVQEYNAAKALLAKK